MEWFKQFTRTTAVRLTLVYSLVFGLLAISVVLYISFNTGRLLIQQFQISVDEEVQEIARSARNNGLRRIIPMIETRSSWPGSNLYIVADATGRILAGNVRDLDRSLLSQDGWKLPPFSYQRFEEGPPLARKAVARVFSLPGNLKLLVGRDIGEAESFRRIVLQAFIISLMVIVFTGLLLWFIVGRRALRHLDRVTKSSQRIIAGDLSQRLPLSGSGDEFDRLSVNLNMMIEQVETLNSGIRQMSDNIAHDLRTPLTRLRNTADAALNSNATTDDKVALEKIVQEADQTIETFEALLTISKIESGARSQEYEEFDAAQMLVDVFELYEPTAEERGVELQLDATPPLLVRGNQALLVQAIVNLVENALKYGTTNDTPKLTLSAYADATELFLVVNDNGEGIAPEDVDRVQDRFVRLDRSRTRSGVGLGLSLVRAVAELHKGELALLSAGRGLKCQLKIPRT